MGLNRRAVMMLAFFCGIIFILQLARMGVMNNSKKYENQPGADLQTISYTLPNIEFAGGFNALIIEDSEADASVRCAENYKSFFSKYKIPYRVVPASDSGAIAAGTDCVVITIGDLSKFNNFENMYAYLEQGGSVIFAAETVANGAFLNIAGALGIIESTEGRYSDYIIDLKGTVGTAGEQYSYYEMVRCVLHVRLRGTCEVYLENENGFPLLWRVPHGTGNIYYSNSNLINMPIGRGVVSYILFEIADGSMLYPSYGILTSIIESFPGPSIVGDYKIFREIRKNYDSFVKEVMWVDFIKLTRRYGVAHTISFVQSYSSEVTPPYDDGSLMSSMLLTYGSEALNAGGEIAYHGFFYRPLGLEDELLSKGWFEPWRSYTDIKTTFNISDTFYRESFPNYTVRCYFPPEGRLSGEVLAQLQEIMPDVSVICFPYHNNLGDQLYGDFMEDEYGYFRYCTTSGIEGAKWNAQNSLYSLGIISQSVDIPYAITIDRLNWSDIISDISSIYESALLKYPSMEATNVSEAVEKMRVYERMNFVFDEDSAGIDVYVDGFLEGMSFMLRSESVPLEEGKDCQVTQIDKNLYSVTPQKPEFRIIFE